jgi:hypothetical protein
MGRIKKPFNMCVDADLLARLEVWRMAQHVPPSKTAILEAALREWLDARSGDDRPTISKKTQRIPT